VLLYQSCGVNSISNLTLLNACCHYIILVSATETAISSASVVDFVTERCTAAYQSIGIPYSLNMKPCKLLCLEIVGK
jgi:hypothetical protein